MRRSMFLCRLVPAPVIVLALASGPGCDQRPPVSTSRTEAVVEGKVVIRGKTVSGGEVVFDPANYLRKDAAVRRVSVGKDGTYKITTLLGANSVRYEGPGVAGSRELEGTSLTCEVKEGTNQFDVVLPPGQ
jgi:hypothetical protein